MALRRRPTIPDEALSITIAASDVAPSRARQGAAFARWLLAPALALLIAACSGADDPPAATPTAVFEATATAPPLATPTPPRPTPTPRPQPVARPFPPDQLAEAQRILERVAELRGTPPKQPVGMFLISRQDAISYFRRSYSAEDLAEVGVRQEIYRLLGLISNETDLLATFLSLLGIGVAGFYEPELDAFYLLDDLGGLSSGPSRTTIVHELAHALQDQHHDLDALDKQREDDWDGQMALAHTIEGDAVNTETLFFGQALRPKPACFSMPARIGLVPYVVYRELNSWYDDGVCFVQAVLPKLENQVARLFERLPATTEQTLHPEKYIAGEAAKPVRLAALAPALGEGWREITRSNLGEFTLQNFLFTGLDDRKAIQDAAAGWGGDAWAFFGRDDARLLQVVTTWDSVQEADEFWKAFVSSLQGRRSSEIRHDPQRQSILGNVGGAGWRGERTGDRVTFLVSTDGAAIDRAAAALGLR